MCNCTMHLANMAAHTHTQRERERERERDRDRERESSNLQSVFIFAKNKKKLAKICKHFITKTFHTKNLGAFRPMCVCVRARTHTHTARARTHTHIHVYTPLDLSASVIGGFDPANSQHTEEVPLTNILKSQPPSTFSI